MMRARFTGGILAACPVLPSCMPSENGAGGSAEYNVNAERSNVQPPAPRKVGLIETA